MRLSSKIIDFYKRYFNSKALSAFLKPVFVAFAAFFVASCDDYYVIAAYDTSDIVYKTRDGVFDVGDRVLSPDEYDKLCFIYPLEFMEKFSKRKWDPGFSEEYYRVLIVKGDVEKVEIIHESWVQLVSDYSVCVESNEEIYVSKIGKDGVLYLNVRKVK